MPQHPHTPEAVKLMQLLSDLFQREVGQIIAGMSGRVQVPGNSEATKEIQSRVDGCVQGVLVVYLFALFGEYVPKNIFDTWLTDDEKDKLLAYKHIRHSVAHGFNGTRAQRCRPEFEAVMNSGQPFSGVVWDRSNDTIDLSKSNVAYACLQEMQAVAQQLTARLGGNNPP